VYLAEVSEEFGVIAEIAVWANGADPNFDPTHVAEIGAATGAASASSLAIQAPLLEADTGDPAGTVVIDATLVAAEPEHRVNDVFRFGNWFDRFVGTAQDFTITSGTLTALGDVYDLTECHVYTHDLVRFGSSPDAFVVQSSTFTVECGWPAEDPIRFLYASGSRAGGSIELFFEDLMISGATEADVSSNGLSAEIPLGTFIGTPLPYVATVDATFEPTGVVETETLVFQGGVETSSRTHYAVSGSFSIPALDVELDMAECTAYDVDTRVRATSPEGPKGKPPANDAPDRAVALDPGDDVRVLTAGASPDPEVEASCLTDDGFAFWGRTVWYSIEGDGAPITIDTAGSNFDTALAVYEVDGDTLAEIACVDDVPTGDTTRTLQASATFDTEAGVTYLVQVGGLWGEAGRLLLAVD
jgi:hypothetical protein